MDWYHLVLVQHHQIRCLPNKLLQFISSGLNHRYIFISYSKYSPFSYPPLSILITFRLPFWYLYTLLLELSLFSHQLSLTSSDDAYSRIPSSLSLHHSTKLCLPFLFVILSPHTTPTHNTNIYTPTLFLHVLFHMLLHLAFGLLSLRNSLFLLYFSYFYLQCPYYLWFVNQANFPICTVHFTVIWKVLKPHFHFGVQYIFL